jgi:hypothetical protein
LIVQVDSPTQLIPASHLAIFWEYQNNPATTTGIRHTSQAQAFILHGLVVSVVEEPRAGTERINSDCTVNAFNCCSSI